MLYKKNVVLEEYYMAAQGDCYFSQSGFQYKLPTHAQDADNST